MFEDTAAVEEWLCHFCQQVACSPLMDESGRIWGRKCFDMVTAEILEPRERMRAILAIVPLKEARSMLNEMMVVCLAHGDCNWRGALKDYFGHIGLKNSCISDSHSRLRESYQGQIDNEPERPLNDQITKTEHKNGINNEKPLYERDPKIGSSEIGVSQKHRLQTEKAKNTPISLQKPAEYEKQIGSLLNSICVDQSNCSDKSIKANLLGALEQIGQMVKSISSRPNSQPSERIENSEKPVKNPTKHIEVSKPMLSNYANKKKESPAESLNTSIITQSWQEKLSRIQNDGRCRLPSESRFCPIAYGLGVDLSSYQTSVVMETSWRYGHYVLINQSLQILRDVSFRVHRCGYGAFSLCSKSLFSKYSFREKVKSKHNCFFFHASSKGLKRNKASDLLQIDDLEFSYSPGETIKVIVDQNTRTVVLCNMSFPSLFLGIRIPKAFDLNDIHLCTRIWDDRDEFEVISSDSNSQTPVHFELRKNQQDFIFNGGNLFIGNWYANFKVAFLDQHLLNGQIYRFQFHSLNSSSAAIGICQKRELSWRGYTIEFEEGYSQDIGCVIINNDDQVMHDIKDVDFPKGTEGSRFFFQSGEIVSIQYDKDFQQVIFLNETRKIERGIAYAIDSRKMKEYFVCVMVRN